MDGLEMKSDLAVAMEHAHDHSDVVGDEAVAAAAAAAAAAAVGADPSGAAAASSEPPLFDEFYEDWAAFDQAVATAIEKHHPIRKRSSLTFEVYNRTVSKGRHDRRPIAEFLSKTFKCTHGIKFRSRGTGKRLRHKLRDIGCPFHIYASAIEYGAGYRVKVRTHDKHNHPIGPDAMKHIGALQDADYDLVQDGDAEDMASPTHGDLDHHVHGHAAYGHDGSADAALSHAVHGSLHHHANAADILDAGVHDSESLLDSSIESHIGEFTSAAVTSDAQAVAVATQVEAQAAAAVAAAAAAVSSPVVIPQTAPPASLATSTFEESTTLEGLRRKIAHFASEREWDQFHTPRNLVLALAGEMGELCECFQWKGDDKPVDQWTPEERTHLGEEMSDVMIYLIRLADKCNIDLPAAIHDKMIKNANKYPADMVKGSSKKYNEYKRARIDKEATL
ncbi:hypothetical protein ATCC90586_002018 [Pythium insidiosum]|nr:hypothetical protein ATCC90586_002018 [Pythium insidiosum]